MPVHKSTHYDLYGAAVRLNADREWEPFGAEFEYDPKYRVVHFGSLSMLFDQVLDLANDIRSLARHLDREEAAAASRSLAL